MMEGGAISLFLQFRFLITILTLIFWVVLLVAIWKMMRATESTANTMSLMFEEMSRRDNTRPPLS